MVKTRQLIESICGKLDCSQRMLANLMGLEPHTLSNNQEKSVEELTPRTHQRLTALYFIVVNKLGLARSEVILEILQAHVFPDLKDRMDSVVSALQQDKYPLETLVHIAELALKKYQDKIDRESSKLYDVKQAASA